MPPITTCCAPDRVARSTPPCLPALSQSPEAEGVLEALRSCQEEARRKHLGLFTYGDPDSDEDDGGFPALGGGRGGGRGAGKR